MQGIYQIKSLKTNKIYVGKSVELEKRKDKHFAPLRKGKHYNTHLQRHFDKYGEADLQYSVIEYTQELDKKSLSEREIYWIKLKGAYGNGNFNQTSGGETGAGETKRRKIRLKNIKTNEIRSFESLSEAGRQLGISPSDIHRLLDGERVKRLGEWTKTSCDYSKVKTKSQKKFTLYHNEHPTFTGHNKAAFARQIGVAPQVINNLIKGKFSTCKGWRTTK
jgi:group I intron endonuclease